MKFTSKVLSIVLVMCMLFTTIGFTATYTDVSTDNASYPAISLLSSLGIIKGYEDGSFGPERNVTRAEFTVMLIRTLNMSGIGSSDPNGLPFQDLAGSEWAISDIRTAYDLGIINGMSETEFAPANQVTSEQALKMIVCAMGYEPMAIDYAGGVENVWPTGYTTVASQLGLNLGVTSAFDAPAKRVEIAKYIYNALETDLMQSTEYPNGAVRTEIKQGVNILNSRLKVNYGLGELRADTENSAEASGNIARDGEVIIYEDSTGENDTFFINDISTKGLVGRTVKYYYRINKNGEKTVIHLEDKTRASSVLPLDPDLISSVTGSWSTGVVIKYWESENAKRTTTIELKKNPTVSVNGRVVKNSNFEPADLFAIDSGSIELIDSTNEGEYNKVNIESYQTYVVGSTSVSSKLIIDMYRTTANNKSIFLDEEDTQLTIDMRRATTGSTLSLSSLMKYNVLSVKESVGANNKRVIEILVSNEKVTGTIDFIDLSSRELGISGKRYILSNYIMTHAANDVKDLQINDRCDFYLDKDDKIAAFEKTASEGDTYVYICGAVAEDDTVYIRLIDAKGSSVTTTTASRVRVDGKSLSDPDDIVTRLTAAEDNADGKGVNASQLVKITRNSAGLISAIDTIAAAENGELDSNLKRVITGKDFTYKSASNQFSNGTDKFMVDANTIIFSVPSIRTDYNEYSKKTLSYFKNDKTYTGVYFEVYDLGSKSTDKAKCIVIYGYASVDRLAANSPLAIISSANGIKTNSVGAQVRNVTGYLFGENEENSDKTVTHESSDTSTFEGAVTGDIYRIATSNGTTFNSYSKKLLSVTGKMGSAFYQEGITGDADEDYIAVHGLLVGASGDSFVIAETNDIDDLINENDVDTYTYKVDSSTIFVTYDADQHETRMLTATRDNILETMQSFDGTKELIERDEDGKITSKVGVEASEIFTYIVNDKVLVVYQIIR